jgi:hypothetical protein
MRYKIWNNIIGWAVFAAAAFTYISTVESTASLWDCSEFILSAYKLEVGHPPGAPLFMMIGHLFTLFSSPENVAFMINVFSALCSAFTILFLFWSITHLARRFVGGNIAELSVSETIMIIGCGTVGALIYTFSDTFWFSAVEGEVYAASSLMTALVFWAILKWEEQADSPYANRWIVLIAYILGLSIGVHLLNLLVVPAIVFVYYFKKYSVTRRGIIYTSIISIVLLAVLVWGIIPVTPRIASWIELLFVNTFGLPINSGLLFFVAILTAALAYAVRSTYRKRQIVMNTIMLCLTFCLLGYGSYAMIVIRSSANLPMDQNKPDNIFSLIKYLNRDQYGSRPLFSGPYFNTKDYDLSQKEKYIRLENKYVKKDISQTVTYKNATLFPRMWSNRAEHVDVYKMFVEGKNPTFVDNIRFFLSYQIGFMYGRYFMWNFVGRQNDMQASIFDPTKGNWISGIKPLDEARLGTMDNLPAYLADNKGNNKYYFLPLLLGVLGLLFQLRKDKKGFTLVTLLFFFTGIAVVMYLNQTPNEPRERDYAYAASFYAFAIWTGMGVAFLYNLLSKYVLKRHFAAPAALLLGLPAPFVMAQQNWDDHDRSGRYVATDFGYNYLNSCDENAVLYTFGDNDTFPLWYNQEVEGQRRDVKVANSMYLASDWYYIQMMRRSHEAPPLATTATPAKIIGETRAYLPVEELRPRLPLNQALQFAFNDNGRKFKGASGIELYIFPSRNLILPINKAQVVERGLALDTSAIVPYLQFKVPGSSIGKNSLAALDFAYNNFLKRPIYYGSSGNEAEFIMGIEGNLRQEGLARQLVPENTAAMPVHIDKTFDLLMNKFRYRGINDPNVYMDETARRIVGYYRTAFLRLAEMLRLKNDRERLKLLMEKYHEVIPEMMIVNNHHTPYWGVANPAVEAYFGAGLNDYGASLAQRLINEYNKEFRYYLELSDRVSVDYEMSHVYRGLADLSNTLKRYSQSDLHKQADKLFKEVSELMAPAS